MPRIVEGASQEQIEEERQRRINETRLPDGTPQEGAALAGMQKLGIGGQGSPLSGLDPRVAASMSPQSRAGIAAYESGTPGYIAQQSSGPIGRQAIYDANARRMAQPRQRFDIVSNQAAVNARAAQTPVPQGRKRYEILSGGEYWSDMSDRLRAGGLSRKDADKATDDAFELEIQIAHRRKLRETTDDFRIRLNTAGLSDEEIELSLLEQPDVITSQTLTERKSVRDAALADRAASYSASDFTRQERNEAQGLSPGDRGYRLSHAAVRFHSDAVNRKLAARKGREPELDVPIELGGDPSKFNPVDFIPGQLYETTDGRTLRWDAAQGKLIGPPSPLEKARLSGIGRANVAMMEASVSEGMMDRGVMEILAPIAEVMKPEQFRLILDDFRSDRQEDEQSRVQINHNILQAELNRGLPFELGDLLQTAADQLPTSQFRVLAQSYRQKAAENPQLAAIEFQYDLEAKLLASELTALANAKAKTRTTLYHHNLDEDARRRETQRSAIEQRMNELRERIPKLAGDKAKALSQLAVTKSQRGSQSTARNHLGPGFVFRYDSRGVFVVDPNGIEYAAREVNGLLYPAPETVDEANKLPEGTEFVTPEGRMKIR